MFGRKTVAAVGAEFLGTAVLASAVLAMAGRTNFPFFTAAAAGLTLMLMVLVIGATSGAHINPAVTLGQWTLRRIDTGRAAMYILAQMAGGFAAWQLNEYLLDQPLQNMAATSFDWRLFTAEAVGTFVFTFGIAAALYQAYDNLQLAVTMGGSLFLGVLIATFASTGTLNPAVALGVRSWSWAYVTGPVVGAVVGMNAYRWLWAPPVRAARVSRAAKTRTRATAAKRPARKTTRSKR